MTYLLSSPRRFGRFFLSLSGLGRIGLIISIAWIFIAIFGSAIAPYGMMDMSGGKVFASSSLAYPLGTDFLGRDLLSRILFGARYSIGLALAATLIASTSGTLLALVSTVIGGWFDEIVCRIVDALLVTPSKILALLVIAIYGSDLRVLVLTAGVIYMPGAFRIARSQAVGINAMEYVTVARLNGESTFHIACREILPNMIHPMFADFGLRFVYNVLMLSGLSFLGLGVQPPYADWGSLVRENLSGLSSGASAVIMPALAIATLTIGVNLLIDSLAVRRHGGARG
ncbi:ABC transporter permease [Paraburkholderia silvatlantica]|uniref:Peptide/nickel transport system permease protein n=1 Tax=Paraburkholderia silvatlantica TaxID=321895 RepID=A0A2U1AC32_9BURK|nr:ABC transporter permease [Paraburkholderia silvatlantica]MBB2925746.1 peptide/nickel transport system permease protein [Paraburkholderia silvatlantica]PVY33138.1 peptide/nickel transport system permease protein [Paraburkholderia silvatlantica]PXW38030.1 peptide/nickel transport system permease protein [Paraburkholderia silvatlantica]PYE28006.1 peptide/nickel transport system permease protein [Paraburkholderia silvatlantica]TDQ92559.1 peptide/nickel transport system permease protein [Parabur